MAKADEREYQMRLRREVYLEKKMVESVKKTLRLMRNSAPEAYRQIVRFITTETVQ